MIRPFTIAVACFALAGCSAWFATPYERPALELPDDWQHARAADGVTRVDWWTAFGDPTLNGLVESALARNNELAGALLNVGRARLQAGLARDARYPQIGVGADAQVRRSLRSGAESSDSQSVSGSVSWEVDLWNRLGHTIDAAELEALATEEDYRAVQLSLVGTVASLYWQIAFLNERIAASEESVAYARQTVELVQVRYDAGRVSTLELAESLQNLESQQAAHQSLLQQRVEQRNALALLFDRATVLDVAEPVRLRNATLPEVDEGLPASLLARRPDLRAAELRLRSSLKVVDAVRTSYYPDLSLTGTLGYASDNLGSAVRNPVGTLGAGLTLPFLQWNQMRLDIAVSRNDYEFAVVAFRQRLYEALVDVENNLAAREHFAVQEAMLERALDAALEAERIYRIRYEAGAVDLQSWLNAQETRRAAEIALSENRLNQLQTYILLSQALGGVPEAA